MNIQTARIAQRCAAVFLLIIAVSGCVWKAPASVTSTGVVSGAVEDDSAISSNGRYVAFTTTAAMVPADTNSIADVYRRDMFSGEVVLVSRTVAGNGGNAQSGQPSISDDGQRVAFSSAATDFGTVANGLFQIYIRDIPAGTTTASSIRRGLVRLPGDGDSVSPSLSGDGSTVTYASTAGNLDLSDTNGLSDIYSYNAFANILTRHTKGLGGALPNGPSTEPSINYDGSLIAFTSEAANLVSGDSNGIADVFTVTDAGSFERVSEGALGEANGPSGQPSISSLSNTVSFSSEASNLVADDINGVMDIFIRAPASPIERVVSSAGNEFAAPSSAPSLSADGSRVAFLTDGANIGQISALIAVVADLSVPSVNAISSVSADGVPVAATHVSISADGDYASFNTITPINSSDINAISDVAARFAYTTRIYPWSIAPGKIVPDTVTAVTISGQDFRVSGLPPQIWVAGNTDFVFSNITVVDAQTITATLSVPATVPAANYQVWVKTTGTGPGAEAGSTQICSCLTIGAVDPVADLVDIGMSIGLPGAHTNSAGLLVDDLNDDGFKDVLFVRHSPTSELIFLGGTLPLTLTQIGVVADRHECDSADVNNDGRTDIYCSVGANQGDGVGYNNLWLQQADGTYIDVAAAWGVTDPYGRGRDVVFLNANNDGLPDLFISNAAPRTDENISANQLFINNGGTSFTAAPQFGVDGELNSTCALSADFDNDGDDDLIVCASDHIHMYANQAGAGFVDVSIANGFNQFIVDADFADIDGDGDLDMALISPTSAEIHRLALGVDVETVFSQSIVEGRSVAFGDLDGNGAPDAYFVQHGCLTTTKINLPDIVALNSGGAGFSVLNPPAITQGCGDAVVAFDHDGDGADGFIVGNGRGLKGPLQYLVLP